MKKGLCVMAVLIGFCMSAEALDYWGYCKIDDVGNGWGQTSFKVSSQDAQFSGQIVVYPVAALDIKIITASALVALTNRSKVQLQISNVRQNANGIVIGDLVAMYVTELPLNP